MPVALRSVFSGVTGGWKKLDAKRRNLLFLFLGLLLVLCVALGVNGARMEYSVLFSQLALEDAGAIVEDLNAKKIPYRLENGGSTILIDESKVDSYRMELAMNDLLPSPTTGFEIFDDLGMMVTEEDRKIMFQRALTGELQRTITTLEGINSAKVHLVLPEKSIFDTEEKEASASVVLDIKPGHLLSQNSIKGIVSLLTGAVDNLPMEKVQVIDSKGNPLSEALSQNIAQTDVALIDEYRTASGSFEKELEKKIGILLGGVFGPENIKVIVNADLNFDGEESTTLIYFDPVVRSEQITATGSQVDSQTVTGGNIDDNISNVVGGNDESSASYHRTVNHELSTETRNVIKAPGKVERITTSVVFNGALTPEDQESIQKMVAAAIGYNETRGDLINVAGMTYAPAVGGNEDPDGEIPTDQKEGFWEMYSTPILIGGALMVVLLFIVLVGRRKREKEEQMLQREYSSAMTLEQEIEDIVVKPDENGTKAVKYAKDHPELVAELIKSWVRE